MLRTSGCCCFCLSLGAGTTLLAFVGLVFSLIGSLTTIGLLANWDATHRAKQFENHPDCDLNCKYTVLRWVEATLITILVKELLHFVSALCLVLAVTVYKGVTRLMAPYLQWLIGSLIFDMLYSFYSCLATSAVAPNNMAVVMIVFLVYWIILVIFKIHFFTVVRAYQLYGSAGRSPVGELLSAGLREAPRSIKVDQRPPPTAPAANIHSSSVVFISNGRHVPNVSGPPPYVAAYQQLNRMPPLPRNY